MDSSASDAIIKAIQTLIDAAMENTTKVFTGLITSVGSNGTYGVLVNGKTYTMSTATGTSYSVNSTVKVVIPEGNMSIAFII